MKGKTVLSLFLIIFILWAVTIFSRSLGVSLYSTQNGAPQFSGQQAYEFVVEQVNMGPRIPGSQAHANIIKMIDGELTRSGWRVFLQEGTYQGHPISNILGKNSDNPPEIILAAHYDSRIVSDQDKNELKRAEPVPGANDGASGVAVLMELSRHLLNNEQSIWLVFLDAEDNGNISGWDWLLGSRYFVSKLEYKPKAVIILDMVGDKDLNIYAEKNSNQELTEELWKAARINGYGSSFNNIAKYSILDDHIPFIEAGIPAVDIIDFDYPYWHTTEDTIDKVSAKSLSIVGSTVLFWVLNQP
jgi:glutaminyl-peptide cyclotransferase